MKYASQYIKSAETVIGLYDGTMPLAIFLKNYFAQHKKFGSKDRKYITHICYCYYRLGHACLHFPIDKRIRIALYLCHDTPGVWVDVFETKWLDNWSDTLKHRIDYLHAIEPSFTAATVFPWLDKLSNNIQPDLFAWSHFIQPDLFLRIRPGYGERVIKKLEAASTTFRQLNAHCIALPNASKIDQVIVLDKEAVIQDYNSQRIAEMFPEEMLTGDKKISPVSLWDCCAASGGKSILAKDTLKNSKLTVSDIRPSILQNLKQRFQRAGISQYKSFIADLQTPNPKLQTPDFFDLIICDAPCSGSGTWDRTPEQLYFFEEGQIERYAALQKSITGNVQKQLAKGGYLLYITCSVFKKENEEIVSYIQQNTPLELVKMELFKGYDLKADSMFAALFKKRAHPAG